MVERVPADSWTDPFWQGHRDRYLYAARWIEPGEEVNDIACGVGYGATFLTHASYRGYDRPAVPDSRFPGEFYAADLNDTSWEPQAADVTVCFETLEHVIDPAHLAGVISRTTRRAVFVSVPVVPTKHDNPWHLTDFAVRDIPLMFGMFEVAGEWAQPSDLSHVWMFHRRKPG